MKKFGGFIFIVILAVIIIIIINDGNTPPENYNSWNENLPTFIKGEIQSGSNVWVTINLNPDKTGSIVYASGNNQGYGNWQITQYGDPVKINFSFPETSRIPSGIVWRGFVELYKNKSANIGVISESMQCRGNWHQNK
jgi:hypothetical protein